MRRQPSGNAEPRDRGDIVLGWLTRVVVVLSTAGLVAFDLVSVAVARVTVADDASGVARAASRVYQARGSVDAAYAEGAQMATQHGENIAPGSFRVEPDAQVRLRLRREARTIIMRRIAALREYAIAQADGSGRFG